MRGSNKKKLNRNSRVGIHSNSDHGGGHIFVDNLKHETPFPTDISKLLVSAIARRSRLFESCQAFRLLDGAGDGVPEMFIDWYSPAIIVHQLCSKIPESALRILANLGEMIPSKYRPVSVYLRVHHKDPRKTRDSGIELLSGPEVDEYVIREGQLSFIVRPAASFHAGLFLDMRDLRSRLLNEARGKRVLNLFCFTGSLGIAAACGGAPEVCQVDSSPSVLDWAKRNWSLNLSSNPDVDMRFICDDCGKFLERESRRVAGGGKRTDIVIVDPPNFGRSRNRVFAFRKDIRSIIKAALSILAPNGKLYCTTNSRSYSVEKVREIALDEANKMNWAVGESSSLLPPLDDFFAHGEESIAMRGVVLTGKG